MKTYSLIFSTIAEPEISYGDITILRSLLWYANYPMFYDFAIIWDEDHDERIIWIAEQLWLRGLLEHIVALGEHKAVLTIIVKEKQSDEFEKSVIKVASKLPDNDAFSVNIEILGDDENDGDYTHDLAIGANLLWRLGKKPCKFRSI